jgi:hypothetical protein
VDTAYEFLGTHYRSPIEEPMYEPYLTIFRSKYALESEDGKTELSNQIYNKFKNFVFCMMAL